MLTGDANEDNLCIPDPSLPSSPATVPTDGFIKYGQSSYSLIKLNLKWHDAEEYCKHQTSSMASILDPYSNAFAWMQIQTFNEPVWIGLNSNLVRCGHVSDLTWLINCDWMWFSLYSPCWTLAKRRKVCWGIRIILTWTRPSLPSIQCFQGSSELVIYDRNQIKSYLTYINSHIAFLKFVFTYSWHTILC